MELFSFQDDGTRVSRLPRVYGVGKYHYFWYAWLLNGFRSRGLTLERYGGLWGWSIEAGYS
jgi:hypothetical protein